MRATKTERKRRKEEKIKEMKGKGKGKGKVLNLKASHDPKPFKALIDPRETKFTSLENQNSLKKNPLP